MSTEDGNFNLCLDALARASIWSSSSVSDEPEIQLIDWDVKKDTAGNCYFVGTRADNRRGRVSTPIVMFDPEHGRGRTQSGRIYELIGPRGCSSNGEYVWSLYRIANGITEAKQ